jgi:hypothetical protein
MSGIGGSTSVPVTSYARQPVQQLHRSLGLRPEPINTSKQRPANGAAKSVPGTRCDARSDARNRRTNRCQAPGATPGRMLANWRTNRCDKSVPGTRCDARSDASKQAARSVPGTRCDARSDASKQAAKSVPGTRCGARSMLANRRTSRCQAPGTEPGLSLAFRTLHGLE